MHIEKGVGLVEQLAKAHARWIGVAWREPACRTRALPTCRWRGALVDPLRRIERGSRTVGERADAPVTTADERHRLLRAQEGRVAAALELLEFLPIRQLEAGGLRGNLKPNPYTRSRG